MFSDKKYIFSSVIFRAIAIAVIIAGIAVDTSYTFGASNDVTISNGSLTLTFNLSWGAVVTGIANAYVGNGLNIVDSHDVGRELQTDQFLSQNIDGSNQLMINPTQAGAGGNQPPFFSISTSETNRGLVRHYAFMISENAVFTRPHNISSSIFRPLESDFLSGLCNLHEEVYIVSQVKTSVILRKSYHHLRSEFHRCLSG